MGAMTVTDEKHGLEVAFKFDGDSQKGGWFSRGVSGASDVVRMCLSVCVDEYPYLSVMMHMLLGTFVFT